MMNYIKSLLGYKYQIILILLLLTGFYALSYLPREISRPLVREDGPIENLSALLFLVTSILFFILFFSKKVLNSDEFRANFITKGKRWVFLIFALIFFFGFGEEISWGQRIFGFDTPEALSEKNAQNEFNIHNLEVFNIRDVDGNRKEGISRLFTSKQLFLYCFFIFLVALPFLNINERFRNLFKRFYIPIPAAYLGALFIGNYIIYRILRSTSDMDVNKALTEIQEFNFAVVLFLIPFTWLSWSSIMGMRKS